MEISLTFGLGIFGNKIAELIKIRLNHLLVATLLSIILLFIVTVALIYYEDEKKSSIPDEATVRINPLSAGILSFIFSRAVTTFPFALIIGIGVAGILINILPGAESIAFSIYINHEPHSWVLIDYDLIKIFIVIVTLYILNSAKPDAIIVLAYALGFATGSEGISLLFRPDENDLPGVALGYLLISFMAVFVRTAAAQGLAKDFRNMLSNISERR